jgi:hypothetical protein
MFIFNYVDLNANKFKEYRRSELWTFEDLREHIHSLLNEQAAIPIFSEFSASARLMGPNIAVEIFQLNVLIRNLLVVISNDSFSRREFELLASNLPPERPLQEPSAPYCASYSPEPREAHLAEHEWISDYELCLAWEWRHFRGAAECNKSLTPSNS